MKFIVKDCRLFSQFVCIAREDYWQIFSQGEANTQRVEEEGEVVLVTEHRTTDGGSREGQVVIRVICIPFLVLLRVYQIIICFQCLNVCN